MILWAIFHPAGERGLLIPSAAMAPTLVLGDRAVMVPYAPGLAPGRGDVIAFADPGDDRSIQVFRVIGLSGDTLELVGGEVVLNGFALPREAMGDYGIDFGFDEPVPAELWREVLPDGRSYVVAEAEEDGFLDDMPAVTVPDDHLFVLGDNRDNAADSRLPDRIGFVPAGSVLGRMDRILASCADDGRFLADRTGMTIGP